MHAKKITADDLKNKRVLLRVDFNVPMQEGVIQDLSRIKHVAPTIEFLKKAEARIILLSHMGKPSGYEEKLSLRQLIPSIAETYNSKIVFVDDCLKKNADAIIAAAAPEDLILLENLRFHREEETCNDDFAKSLASLADFYINDAFSTSHRRHASICAMPKFLPHAFGLAFMDDGACWIIFSPVLRLRK
jgi:phosphoglycerate kinase